MGRIILTNTEGDMFCQFEWVDQGGSHTKRVSEDMPPAIKAHALALIEWADAEEKATYAPISENYEDGRRIEQEIGRLQVRLALVRAK